MNEEGSLMKQIPLLEKAGPVSIRLKAILLNKHEKKPIQASGSL